MKTINPQTLLAVLAVLAGAALIGCGGETENIADRITPGGSTAGNGSAGNGSTAGGGSTAGSSTAGGSTAGGSTAGGSSAGGSTAGGTTAGGTPGGGTGGTGTTPAAPGEVTSVNLGISGVTGNASTLPLTTFADAASEVTTDGSTVNVSVGQLNTGGLLSRTLDLVLNDSSIEVGDTYALNATGPNGADVSLIQAIGLPTNLAAFNAASGGAVRVIAKDGDDITLRLENVRLDADVANGALAVGGLNLDGTIRFTLP